jgi:hypothetical protein
VPATGAGARWISFNWDGCTMSHSAEGFSMFKMFRLARGLRVLRLIRVIRLYDKYQDTFVDWLPILSFVKLVLTLFLLGHFLGCTFYVRGSLF